MKLFERSVKVLTFVGLRRERVLDVEHNGFDISCLSEMQFIDLICPANKLSIMLARQSGSSVVFGSLSLLVYWCAELWGQPSECIRYMTILNQVRYKKPT